MQRHTAARIVIRITVKAWVLRIQRNPFFLFCVFTCVLTYPCRFHTSSNVHYSSSKIHYRTRRRIINPPYRTVLCASRNPIMSPQNWNQINIALGRRPALVMCLKERLFAYLKTFFVHFFLTVFFSLVLVVWFCACAHLFCRNSIRWG